MLSELPNVKFEIHEKVKLSNEELSFNNLTSLDLQPIVKVYDNKKEVEITGYLVLSGEFIVKNQYLEDQLDQFDALHYDTLLSNEYKVDSFQQQIPLTIQVDNKRVEEINSIIVKVEEFDYEIISDQEIELTAQVKLIGVKPEDEIIDEPLTKSKLGITTKVDINSPINLSPIYTLLRKEQNEAEEKLVLTDIFEDDLTGKAETEKAETLEAEILDIEDDTAKVTSSAQVNKSNILYGLLHGDEIQSYKMKIYITQKDDTIQKIAEKYGLRSEDIISNNNITKNELQPGQLLYLPVKK
ncbi:MAG: LysM peptidoglycan-binding domain-containing protein [Vulcanibacillus sp.]